MTSLSHQIQTAMTGLKMPRALEVPDHTLSQLEQGEITAPEAINMLLNEKFSTREGRLAEKSRFYARVALLIVDEIGYLPISTGGANLFFQRVNARYEKGAMILTSNRGFAEWAEIFGHPVVATALLDRLLHHAVVTRIDGASLMPDHVRANAALNPQPPPKKHGRHQRKENNHQ